MSKLQNFELLCDICGRENQVDIWQSINVSLNPELKIPLLDGSLFKIRCKQCNSELELVYSLLYHDQGKRIMVWKVVAENDREPQLPEGIAAMEGMLGPENYRLRIVLSRTSLSEKIRVFDDNLDDRIIELLKKNLWEENRVDHTLSPDSVVYHAPIYKNANLDKIQIKQFSPKGQERNSYDISFDGGYMVMKNMVTRKFGFVEHESTRWSIADNQYWDLLTTGRQDARMFQTRQGK